MPCIDLCAAAWWPCSITNGAILSIANRAQGDHTLLTSRVNSQTELAVTSCGSSLASLVQTKASVTFKQMIEQEEAAGVLASGGAVLELSQRGSFASAPAGDLVSVSTPQGSLHGACSPLQILNSKSRPCDISVMIKVSWFPAAFDILNQTKVFNRMCWLKTLSNARHTTSRMHEDVIWPCIFGCTGCADNLMHYLICRVLWQIANEIIGHESSVHIGS